MIEYNTLSLAVEGYPGQQSYRPGEEVTFHCSSRVRTFSVEVARIGATREVVWRKAGHRRIGATGPGGCLFKRLRLAGDLRLHHSRRLALGLLRGGADRRRRHGTGGDEPRLLRRPRRRAGAQDEVPPRPRHQYLQRLQQVGRRSAFIRARRASPSSARWSAATSRKPIDLDGFDGRAANISPEPDPDHNRLQQYLSEHKVAMWTCSAGWHNWERRFVRWAEGSWPPLRLRHQQRPRVPAGYPRAVPAAPQRRS